MEFIHIENRKNWLVDIPKLHPDSTQYTLFWSDAKRKCIEGFWNKDFDGYRYMPGNLFFYVNFCRILDVDEATKTRISIKPILTDLMWEIFYMVLEAKGFSGWSEDNEFTSNWIVREIEKHPENRKGLIKRLLEKNTENEYKFKECFIDNDINKSLKKFLHPRDNIRSLHKEVKGLPLYQNNAKNTMLFGARGSGKSYAYGIGLLLHEIVFDGAKYYTEDTKKKPAEVHVNIGAALSDKSAELCEKIESCMNAFATDQELGAWGDESSDDYEPMPFFKSMAGSLTPNNAKSPWRHEYEKKVNGRWLKFGSKSKIVHSVYKDNSHAAAGGRYTQVLVEECGLASNLREIHGSNIATTQRGTLKFGSQHYIGTSGDLEKVKEAREMFMNPQVYDILSYNDVWENSGEIGFFIPAYYAAFEFKDENGNTDLEAAKTYYHERREQKRKAKDPTQYQAELMNYPIKPSEMFLTKKSNVLPVAELEQHRINIITNQYKGKLETYGSLIFDPNSPRGVKFIPKPKHEAFPIKSFPTPKDYSLEGELIIYEFPIIEQDGSVPPIYIIGYDPVHKDEEGSSLNCIHVLKTPKNFAKYGGNELVASYIGRPYAGRKPVNELAEKLAMWYGNKPRMIFFEAGGNNVKEYFEKRQKLNLLATQPTTVLTNKFSNSPTRSLIYGVPMNNLDIKMEAIGYLRDWLLQQRGTDESGRLIMNLNMINDTRLIEEMLAFDYDINTDSVMAFAMCIVGLEETHNQYKVEQVQKAENILDFLNRSIERKYFNYKYN